MKIAVIGGGGREHALGWKLAQSPEVNEVIGIPGNAGWINVGPTWPGTDPLDADFGARLRQAGVDLVVIGPEAPLVAGLADTLRDEGMAVFGPGSAGARFEGSKIVSKEFMARHGIPTADFAVFSDADEARAWVRERGAPIVVKADGLAAGKGVVVASTVEEAEQAIDSMLVRRQFGDAGTRILIESCLEGEEVSILALVDGETIVPLAPSQDHKRIGDGDTGPNTGGMGAYVPTTLVDETLWQRIRTEVLERTVAGFRAENIDYRGVLYCGLMIVDGEPYVLEYNVRFGDPECQPLMVHLASDLAPLLMATAEGRLSDAPEPEWHDGYTICVVLASEGYPGTVRTGVELPELPDDDPDVVIFHAGTKLDRGRIVTAGGRVLGVTARGADIETARARAYGVVERVAWPGAQYRTDIALRELRRQRGHTAT